MSVDLAVKLTCPVTMASVLSGTEEALKEILCLSEARAVYAEDHLSKTTVNSSAFLDTTTGMIKIYVADYPDDPAFLFVSDRPGDPLTGEGSGNFAVVEMHGESLGNLVGAATAVAIARKCGSKIEDNLPYFSKSFEHSPAEFVAAMNEIVLREPLRSAAQKLRASNGDR